jgi:hypothetical protein
MRLNMKQNMNKNMKGGDLATILALGNWSSNNIYQRFHQRGIKLMLAQNRVSNLILAIYSAVAHVILLSHPKLPKL